MFKSDQTKDRQLFAFSVRDLIPEESDVWLYMDLFEDLDLKAFESDYSKQGEEGHEPKLILQTIFYGLTHGIVTGRKLADACRHDSRYVVLSGQNHPSYRTFSRFVIRHQKRIEDLFVQIVRLAQKMELASLGRIAIDGSRFKANTSKHKAMSYGRMEEAIQTIKEELAKLKDDLAKMNAKEQRAYSLPAEITRREKRLAKIHMAKAALEEEARRARQATVDAKAQKSFNDLEAKPSARLKSGFMYAYNCQAAVDADHQIIVAAKVHDSAGDVHAFGDVLNAVENNCEKTPKQVLADAAYNSRDNLKTSSDKGSEAFFALGKGEKVTSARMVDAVKYYGKRDQFRCRGGKNLTSLKKLSKGKRCLTISEPACRQCPLQTNCLIFGRSTKPFWIPDAEFFHLTKTHRRRMTSPEGKAVYARRKVIVEPVFGNIKNKGMRILRRGKGKANCWWQMACTAHNIEKILKHR